ncbi:DUF6241 domain-containing protein [Neobacillus sp. OS1-32]|uniref:PRK06770 family protein n=1 Tax=Neobacillus paridis TaxID=2803862 RepID=A0ABS1THW6_9BACI|nr:MULTISPECIES: DUF6241 domain-containing protein [Neobacillus]MBL4950920.1 PRK06770 family protein [Neobacillus paridis]WML29993.1 DUF6241 domain-containing protein [Neobacillus sp. OS1-32]
MKKLLLLSAIVLVVLVGGIFGFYKLLDKTSPSAPKKPVTQTEKKAETVSVTVDEEELDKQQTEKIGGVQYKIDLDKNSSQNEVIDIMHKMTHQKVKAEEKWGAVPMIPDTINQVYEIVRNSDFDIKDDLLAILEKWKNGQFSEVVEDHNYFWRYQDGTIGKAYGKLDSVEEKEFIANNFGEDFAKRSAPGNKD